MPRQTRGMIARLKQHHLYGVMVAYAVVVGFLIQLLARVLPYYGWERAVPVAITILLLGFPVALVLAWLLIRPREASSRSIAWQHRHWKLGVLFSSAVIALVAVSGFYALQFSRAHMRLLQAQTTSSNQASATAAATPLSAAVIPAKSIAVLPFENLSDDKQNEYFVSGMQGLILTKLVGIGELKVIARTSTARYASHPDDIRAVGRELGVATILEGSVQKQGNIVLIDVRLIDARNAAHLWAQSYERRLDHIFGVEGEVAEQVASALLARLSTGESARLAEVPTSNEEAYDLFLHAEYLARQGDLHFRRSDLEAALPLYRQAIARDPNFALAYARLSYAEGAIVWYGSGEDDPERILAEGLVHARRALALQPQLVAGQLALGSLYLFGHEDYPRAIAAFTAALKLRPGDAEALALLGLTLRRQGRLDAALAKLQQTIALDPGNAVVATWLADTYATVGRDAEAERYYRRALSLEPGNGPAKVGYSVLVLARSGDLTRALNLAQGNSELERSWQLQLLTLQRRYPEALALREAIPDAIDTLAYQSGPKALVLANLYRLMGDNARAGPLYVQALPQARARLARLAYSPMKSSFVWGHIAAAELGLGRTAEALASIRKSQVLAARSGNRFFGPWLSELNAALYAQASRPDLAVPLLAQALATPGGRFYPPVMLWLDPAWDPIRKDPHFQVLLTQYAQYKPAVIPSMPASSSAS